VRRWLVVLPAQEAWVDAENAHEAARNARLDQLELGWRVLVVRSDCVAELTVDFVEKRETGS
jgi:hypothetical protein